MQPGAQPDDHLVTKLRWGAFHDTSLDGHLQELGVTQVVLAGIATSIGVESTARSAHEHGYHVVLATDAMTDRDPAAHDNSVERIFPKLGETATAAEILDLRPAAVGWRRLQGAIVESDQPIIAASVSGAVVESARSCPVSGITTTLRCALGTCETTSGDGGTGTFTQ